MIATTQGTPRTRAVWARRYGLDLSAAVAVEGGRVIRCECCGGDDTRTLRVMDGRYSRVMSECRECGDCREIVG